jgi:acyl carrier protein
MTVKSTVTSEICEVAKEQGVTITQLPDSVNLTESGLDSLGLAIVVVRLEDKLGVDPFRASQDVSFPVTVADFVKAYEDALQ